MGGTGTVAAEGSSAGRTGTRPTNHEGHANTADREATSNAEKATVQVHVVGEVHRPGVVTLPAGARVADAIQAAGGPRRDARPERINLAAPLADGQQVLVPDARTPEEVLAGAGAATPPATGAAGSAAPAASADGAPGAGGRVDLNTADAATLETLPGVGPAMAQKIIGHRETVGPFTGLQDLDAVPGIGPATLDRLRDHVTW